ncbi:MAG: hypothetical protein R3D88_00820 [Alphaproteobacteria bacterium]|nr:hypothetical protein [Alphaproteobacteria bacterium]
MTKTVYNVGDIITIGEPPLPKTIDEIEVSFETPDGAMVYGVLCQPNDRPITQKALMLHEIEGHTEGGAVTTISRRYARLGIASLRIDFSGHGKRKDEWERYSPQSMLLDAKESLDWLDKKFPDIQQTMLTGFSTGGGIAVLLRGLDKRVSKSCLLYPVLSFKQNFLAAVYDNEELFDDIEKWDKETLWRAMEFTKEKINDSLNNDKPFSLTAHTYGAGFIKGCVKAIDEGDISRALFSKQTSPVTVIQGTMDICVPHSVAHILQMIAKEKNVPMRLVTMRGMDHWVPPVWKRHVWEEFRKVAIGKPEDFFDPSHRIIKLRPKEKGFVDLMTLIQEHKDQGLVQQIG